jgi:hypothetical protein
MIETMTDDDCLQEVDTDGDGGYFPQMPSEKVQAERLESEGFLQGFIKDFPGESSQKRYRLTPKGKLRVPRYRP